MKKVKLISFMSATSAYEIFYPEDFILNEDDDSIVTITSPITFSNMTLSVFFNDKDVTEKKLLELFKLATESFESISKLRKGIINNYLSVEQKFLNDDSNWIWWGIAKSNKAIIVSVNSSSQLSSEDYDLYKFMLSNLEIH